VRALVIGALALSLVGCSRQPPPPASITSCGDANGAPCLGNRAVGRPIALAPSRAALAARAHKSSLAAKTKRPSLAHARAKVRLAAKAAKSTTVGARAEPPAPRIPLPPPAPRPPPQPAKSAADSAASRVEVADAHPTGSRRNVLRPATTEENQHSAAFSTRREARSAMQRAGVGVTHRPRRPSEAGARRQPAKLVGAYSLFFFPFSLLLQVLDMACEFNNQLRHAREMLGSWLRFPSYLLAEYLSHRDYLLQFQCLCLPRLRPVLLTRHPTPPVQARVRSANATRPSEEGARRFDVGSA